MNHRDAIPLRKVEGLLIARQAGVDLNGGSYVASAKSRGETRMQVAHYQMSVEMTSTE
jgi:hypothetical protein